MPFKPNIIKELGKVVNCVGPLIYPMLISLALPVFLYTFVMEKEYRLIQNMKINGMQMSNYWMINTLYFLFFYLCQVTIYYSFGNYVAQLTFFQDTSSKILIPLFFGWGLCQVSLAFFYQCFMNSIQTAQMIGYTLAIIGSVVTSCVMMSGGIYDENGEMIHMFRYYPSFNFVRAVFTLSHLCAWDSCIEYLEDAPKEIMEVTWCLYYNAAFYLVLALYLNEVVPQTYGIPKHPLYFLEGFIKQSSPALYKQIFGDEDAIRTYKDDSELVSEDNDVRTERKAVEKLTRSEYFQYPLVIKDIRKVYPSVHGRPPKIANKNISFLVKSGELFGLLGPNGAGKTTLISQLTGLYSATSGNAWISGYSL